MQESIEAIQAYTPGCLPRAIFILNDPQIQDAVCRRLEIIGDAANKLESEFTEKFPNIPWYEIIAMRNILIQWQRPLSSVNTKRIDHLYKDPHLKNGRMSLHYGDMTDSSNLNRILEKVHPDEIYNLAAQSHVKVSFAFEVPEYKDDVNVKNKI